MFEVFAIKHVRFMMSSLRPSIVTEVWENPSAPQPFRCLVRHIYNEIVSSDLITLPMSIKGNLSARRGFYLPNVDNNITVRKLGHRLRDDSLATANSSSNAGRTTLNQGKQGV